MGGNTTQQHQKAGGTMGSKRITATAPENCRYQAENTMLWRGGGEDGAWTDSMVQLVKWFLDPLLTSFPQSISPNFEGAGECMSAGPSWAEMGLTSWLYEGGGRWDGEVNGRHRLVSKFKYYSRKIIKHNNNNSNNHLQRWETSPGGCSSPPHRNHHHHYNYYYYCYHHNMGGRVNFISFSFFFF